MVHGVDFAPGPRSTEGVDFTGEGLTTKMNLNTKYGVWLVQHGKGYIIRSDIKNGFIVNTIVYRDSYGIVRYGKYREKLEKENERCI